MLLVDHYAGTVSFIIAVLTSMSADYKGESVRGRADLVNARSIISLDARLDLF